MPGARLRVRAVLVTSAVVLVAALAAPGGGAAARPAAAPPGIDAFMVALGAIESGGRYTARNPRSGAYGKYQIMPANWPAWARRYVGDRTAPPTPDNQERVARGRLSDLYRQYGAWDLVAYWWLTGKNGRTHAWSARVTRYVRNIMAVYQRRLATVRGGPTIVSDASPSIRYAGRWRSAAHRGYSGGHVRYATARGATATVTFTGSAVAWVGPRGPTRGKALVILDGHAVATVNLFATRFGSRRTVFTRSWPGPGRHTLAIRVLGTRGHAFVAIDDVVVQP